MKRIAAALLLTRGAGPDLEVFLVERAAELRFFGGYHALPGGVLSPDDMEGGGAGEHQALLRCAHRELFEETGVLLHSLPATSLAPERLAACRRTLLERDKRGESGGVVWRELVGDGAPPELTQVCRIETPPFSPVRYDTVFFHVPLDDHTDEPEVWHGELVSGRFWKPAEALSAWHRGEVRIVPPILILLELMLDEDRGTVEIPTFLDRAAEIAESYRRGALHRVRFSPGVLLASLRSPTLPPATTTNCYVVGDERLFVVDPASPEADEQQRLEHLLEELAGEGRALEAILVTHHHPDHVGGVHALSARFDLPVRAHPLTLSRLQPGFRIGAPLQDGDRIPLGNAPDGSPGWELEAVFTPGHDRGHLCFRENRYGAAIVGDMLSTVSTIVVDPPEGHLQTYLDSLERLLREPMTTLYPAHGPAIPDGHRLLRQYLRHRRQRETTLVNSLRERGPSSVLDLLPKVYWDVDESMYPIAARSLLAGLEKLQEEERARCEAGRWSLVFPEAPDQPPDP